MSAPNICTKRLSLREIKNKDIFGYYNLFSDKETMEMFGGSPIKNDLEIKDIINRIKKEYVNKQSIFWVITIKNKKEFIGFVRLMSYNSFYFDASYQAMGELRHKQDFLKHINKNDGWELDYALTKEYRRQGIMTETLVAVLDYCENSEISPVYAKVNKQKNEGSIRLLKKNGFKELMPQISREGEIGMIYKL